MSNPESPRSKFDARIRDVIARDGQVRARSFDAKGQQQALAASETGAVPALYSAIRKFAGYSAEQAKSALEAARQSATVAKAIGALIVGDRNDLSYRLIPEAGEPGWLRVQAIRPIQLPNGRVIPAGELGGLVQGERNLHQGGAWIGRNARVSGNGLVMAGAFLNTGEVTDQAVLFGPVTFNGMATGNACLTTSNFNPCRIDGVFAGSARVTDGKLLTPEGEVRVADISQRALVCDSTVFEAIDNLPASAKTIVNVGPGHAALADQFRAMSSLERKNTVELLRSGQSGQAAMVPTQPGVAYRLAKEMPWVLETLGLKMSVEARQARSGGVDKYLDLLCEGRAKVKGVSLTLPEPEVAKAAPSRPVARTTPQFML